MYVFIYRLVKVKHIFKIFWLLPSSVNTFFKLFLNHTSCTQVHELPRSHCGDDQEDTLFSLCIYNIFIYGYIYVYIFIYIFIHIYMYME